MILTVKARPGQKVDAVIFITLDDHRRMYTSGDPDRELVRWVWNSGWIRYRRSVN